MLREVKRAAQGHAAQKEQRWDLILDLFSHYMMHPGGARP